MILLQQKSYCSTTITYWSVTKPLTKLFILKVCKNNWLESPLSIYVNCRNHRLALCFVHLIKENKILVDAVLMSIWTMFEYSPKKAAVIQYAQEVYWERPFKFVRAVTTRSMYYSTYKTDLHDTTCFPWITFIYFRKHFHDEC